MELLDKILVKAQQVRDIQTKVFSSYFLTVNYILMNATFGIQFNKKAKYIRQHFVAILATSSGQLNVIFFSINYANIVENYSTVIQQ